MNLVSRILPREEWPRLVGTEAERLWPLMAPGAGEIVAVEDDGQIVGCWAILRVVHAECVWVAPAYRKRGQVARRLLRLLAQVATAMGVRSVVTGADRPEVVALLEKLHATRVPGDLYVLPIPTLKED